MALQKFSSQARPELLEEVRGLAAEEGRQFQAVLDEALAEWVARKKGEAPRTEVIGHRRLRSPDIASYTKSWPSS